MGQKGTLLAIGLIIFAVILVILFIVSRVVGSPKGEDSIVETFTEQTTENLVPVSKIISTPAVYNGYSLAVDSQVSGWTTNRSFYFTAQDSGFLSGGTKGILLAIAREPFKLPDDPGDDMLGLGENSQIIAKGKIQILNKEQLQEALDVNLEDPTITINNSIIAQWQLGPVLIIDSLEIAKNK